MKNPKVTYAKRVGYRLYLTKLAKQPRQKGQSLASSFGGRGHLSTLAAPKESIGADDGQAVGGCRRSAISRDT